MKTKEIIQYVFSGIILLATLVFFGLLLYVEIPKSNESLIMTASGIFLSSGWTQILNWWFGSSKGSADKNELLTK